MNKNDFVFLVLLATIAVYGFYKIQERLDVVVHVTTQPATQPAVQEIVESTAILPTWTPFYSSPTLEPQPTDLPAIRGGFPAPTPSGNIGTHNPGRSDKRTP